jgi:hypothetical protein
MVEHYDVSGQQTLFPLPYKYLIDTCSILTQKSDEPHRRSVFGGLWNKIEELIDNNVIVICSEVELEVEDEPIKQWLNQHQCVVLGIDDEIQRNVTKVVTEHSGLVNFKNNKSSADAFIIATAMYYRLAVITEEKKGSPNKIPKICEAYGIPCFNIAELAEEEHWSF